MTAGLSVEGQANPTPFSQRPVLVFWETTRACALSCVHCRASAIKESLPGQLDTAAGKHLVDEVSYFGKPAPTVIFTGGDPMLRGDLLELMDYAKSAGVRFAVSPAASQTLTYDALRGIKEAGAVSISISLDGANAETHDSIRREAGTFARTVQAVKDAVAVGLNPQINTTVMRRNLSELPKIFRGIRALGVKTWEVFFLVQVGRGTGVEDLTPAECETACNLLYDASLSGVTVRAVEAPFVRRVSAERARSGDYWGDPSYLSLKAEVTIEGAQTKSSINPRGTLDGDGIIFVGYDGTISPGGLLPLGLGNIKSSSLRDVYRDHPLLKKVRGRAFTGLCGMCEFMFACGGSRARAFAKSGDPLSSDPACVLVGAKPSSA